MTTGNQDNSQKDNKNSPRKPGRRSGRKPATDGSGQSAAQTPTGGARRRSGRSRNKKSAQKVQSQGGASVLVIGSGGREHTLVWKLRQSSKVERIFCAPGNGGVGQLAKCVNIKPENVKALAEFAQRNSVDLTIVGPEAPLALGIADEFQRRKLRIFGPEKKAAQLESSKIFAKQFLQKYHIPTAPFRVFDSAVEATGFCKSLAYPAVIKADGLAAGKGVVIVKSLEEAYQTIHDIMLNNAFGKAGNRIVIESFIPGQEVSIMALIDGKTIVPLLPSQDHKQALEGDRGPNTGGMGAYCPATLVTPELMDDIDRFILLPTLNGLRNEKINYRGIIYAGLMITPEGPKVLEFNCRFGDPETQAVLPLLKSDLFDLMMAVCDKKLSSAKKPDWKSGSSACVVLTSKGYPGSYRSGYPIDGLRRTYGNNALVFHAGTKRDGKNIVTAGGRVLGVVGMNQDLKTALQTSYDLIKTLKFEGMTYRRDIGFRVLQALKGN